MDKPLISCVMLTRDRPLFAQQAFEMWKRQTYPNRELIVIDNGTRNVSGIRSGPGVRCFRIQSDHSIGKLRNFAAIKSVGQIIAHWDDDDYQSPDRLEHQFSLLTETNCEVIGYRTMYFRIEQPIQFLSPRGGKQEVGAGNYMLYCGDSDSPLGTSLFYPKRTWQGRQFADISQGEDFYFCDGRHVVTADAHDPVRMIARHHIRCQRNPGKFDGDGWRRVPQEQNERLDGYFSSV